MNRTVRWLLFLLLTAVFQQAGQAQEFRVYTRVYDVSAGKATSKPLARSLSLFHAGSVYDYIQTAGEVTIFNPVRHQFTILSTSRGVVTTVQFDALKHMLKMARGVTRQRLAELRRQTAPRSQTLFSQLQFQLSPRFVESYDSESKRLRLASRFVNYTARCAEVDPSRASVYLRYADWAARLNYVLRPHVLLPQCRLALNDGLRRRNAVPVAVELRTGLAPRIHLRADHQIRWQLDRNDKSLIFEWKTLLKGDRLRRVPFREYQKTMLVAQSRHRR